MSSAETDSQQNAETLEHLLGVVVESREKRCAQVREKAQQQVREIIRQAHARGRARMHRHVIAMREKYRLRVASAHARNQTLLRQQHQKEDRAILDVTWPLLREAMLTLWKQPDSRRKWLDAAVMTASSSLREHDWHVEHPPGLSKEEKADINHGLVHGTHRAPRLTESENIEAGIRIIVHGTVIDATLDGLLKQKTVIEAALIARIKQAAISNE